MWRVTVAMYLAGAVTIAATFAAPDPDTSDRTAMSVLGAVSLALGLGLLAAGPRRVLVAKVAPIAGVLLLSTVIAVARPIGATPLFYLWPILLAAYYGSSRYLVATLAVFCTTFAAASAIAAPSARHRPRLSGTWRGVFPRGGVVSTAAPASSAGGTRLRRPARPVEETSGRPPDPEVCF